MQDHNLAHNDVSPMNVATVTLPDQTGQPLYQLISLGCCTPLYDDSCCPVHNALVAQRHWCEELERLEGTQDEALLASLETCTCCGDVKPPPVEDAWNAADLTFSPMRRLLNEQPTRLTDLLSVAFCLIKLSGGYLVWPFLSAGCTAIQDPQDSVIVNLKYCTCWAYIHPLLYDL